MRDVHNIFSFIKSAIRMENKVSIVLDDKAKGDIRAAIQGLDNLLHWTIGLQKDEIKGTRILSMDDMAELTKGTVFLDQHREIFRVPEKIDEFKKDLALNAFCQELLASLGSVQRKLQDTEIRTRQEIDSFGRHARDRFETEAKQEPIFKAATDFFKSIFNKKPQRKPKSPDSPANPAV